MGGGCWWLSHRCIGSQTVLQCTQTLLQNHSLKTFIVLNQKIRRLGNKLTEKERKEYILGYWGGDLGAIASLSKTHRKRTKESLKIVKLYKYPPPLINPILIRHVFIVLRFILAKGQDKIAEMRHILWKFNYFLAEKSKKYRNI